MLDLSGTKKRKWARSLGDENKIDTTILLIPSTNSFHLKTHRIKALRCEFFKLLRSQAMNLIEIRYQTLQ